MSNLENFAAIVLAAGKGKRMNSKTENKVTLLLGKRPMILHTIELLEKLGIRRIVVVVGFKKESVMELLDGRVTFSEQRKRLGTAHALYCGMKKVSRDIKNIIALNGDDSAFYKSATLKELLEKHIHASADFTFLTIEMKDPSGLGRIVRDKNGKLISVVEEKDAMPDILKIKEINPACYIFKVDFLKKYLPKVKRSPVTGEYYLTSLIDIGIKANEKVDTLAAGPFVWRGVNTKDELEEAEKVFMKIKDV